MRAAAGVTEEDRSGDVLATSQAGPAAVRGGALRVGGYVAGSLLSAVSAALLLRHLGQVAFGLYITALSLVAIVDGVSDLGLTAIGVREMSLREGERRARYAQNLLGLRIAVTVIGVFAMVVFAVAVNYRVVVVEGVVVAGVALLLQCATASLSISLMSQLRLGWVTAIDLVRQLVFVALVIVFVVVGAGLLAFLALAIPAAAAALALTVWLVRGDMRLRPSFDRAAWREMLILILPFSAAAAAAVIYFRMAVIVVSLLVGARELGDFGAAFRVAEALLVVPGLAASVGFPIFARAARDDRERLGYAVNRVFALNLLIGAWAGLCVVIGARLAIRVLAGPEYRGAGPILAIQGVAIGASFLTALWGQVLLSLGRLRTILVLNASVLIVGLIAEWGLVLADGARGAAIATSSIELVAAVAGGVLVVQSDHRLHLPVAMVPRVALATALAATALLLPIGAIGRLVYATVVYTAAVFALRLVPEEVKREISALWNRYVARPS